MTVALTGALLSRDRLTEESCDREYTLEEIQRYITFAKQFKPKVRAQTLCVDDVEMTVLAFVLQLSLNSYMLWQLFL